VAFTSARAALAFLEALRRGGGDARWLAGVTVGAVGQATRAALAQGGVAADVVGESGGASLGEAMARALGPGGRLLLVQAEGGRPEAREVAVSLGIQVHTVAAYAMGPAPEEPLLRPRIKRALAGRGSVLFPWYSPRAVAEAAARLALGGARVRHVAVGATTAQAVREAWPRARVWTAARPEALAVQEALARAYGGEAGSARENQAKGGKACPYGSRWRAR
jgi:uroporphyrinogen-III synthase